MIVNELKYHSKTSPAVPWNKTLCIIKEIVVYTWGACCTGIWVRSFSSLFTLQVKEVYVFHIYIIIINDSQFSSVRGFVCPTREGFTKYWKDNIKSTLHMQTNKGIAIIETPSLITLSSLNHIEFFIVHTGVVLRNHFNCGSHCSWIIKIFLVCGDRILCASHIHCIWQFMSL